MKAEATFQKPILLMESPRVGGEHRFLVPPPGLDPEAVREVLKAAGRQQEGPNFLAVRRSVVQTTSSGVDRTGDEILVLAGINVDALGDRKDAVMKKLSGLLEQAETTLKSYFDNDKPAPRDSYVCVAELADWLKNEGLDKLTARGPSRLVPSRGLSPWAKFGVAALALAASVVFVLAYQIPWFGKAPEGSPANLSTAGKTGTDSARPSEEDGELTLYCQKLNATSPDDKAKVRKELEQFAKLWLKDKDEIQKQVQSIAKRLAGADASRTPVRDLMDAVDEKLVVPGLDVGWLKYKESVAKREELNENAKDFKLYVRTRGRIAKELQTLSKAVGDSDLAALASLCRQSNDSGEASKHLLECIQSIQAVQAASFVPSVVERLKDSESSTPLSPLPDGGDLAAWILLESMERSTQNIVSQIEEIEGDRHDSVGGGDSRDKPSKFQPKDVEQHFIRVRDRLFDAELDLNNSHTAVKFNKCLKKLQELIVAVRGSP